MTQLLPPTRFTPPQSTCRAGAAGYVAGLLPLAPPPNAWGGPPTVGLPLAAAATSAVIATRFVAGQRS